MNNDVINDILKYDPSNPKKEDDGTIKEVLKHDPMKTPEERVAEEKHDVLSWGDALMSGVKNFPSSTVNYLKNIFSAIAHPVRTGEAMGQMAAGVAQMADLKEPSDPESITQESTEGGYEKVKPLVDELKNRYGSIEKFKRTVAEDPAGVLADVSALVIPAGKVTGLSKVAELGATLEPVNLAMNAAKLPFKLLPEKISMDMYQSAVKFGTTLSEKQRNAITKTALTRQIMPTQSGLSKLRGLINDYNEKITTLINESAESGRAININRMYQGLDEIKKQFKRTSDEPLQWDAAFSRMKKQWKEAVETGQYRTPQEIQKLKQNIYKDLESYYEKHKATPAKVELRKAVARNARKTLEEIIPEIKQLNKNEGELIELWDSIESKANRISNRDLIGIGLPVKMGAGSGIGYMFAGEAGGAAGGMMGFALGIFDTPQVKAKIALVLSKMRERGISVKMTPTVVRLLAYEAERSTDNK